MISNKDMEKLWLRYQREGVARNLSLQAFCSMNNVPYNSFEKYLKTRRGMSDVYEIQVTDIPAESSANSTETPKASDASANMAKPEPKPSQKQDRGLRILVSIKMTNGISITQGNLDYLGLRGLVEKLEVLC